MEAANNEQLFTNIGLKPNVVKQTLANAKVTQTLASILKHNKVEKCDEKKGALFYGVATKLTEALESRRELLSEYVAQGKITSAQQLDMAITYLRNNAGKEKVDTKEFDEKIGVGVVVTEADIKKAVADLIKEKDEDLKKNRYTVDLGAYLRTLRERIPFGDGALITKTFNDSIAQHLGPQTEEDKKMKEQASKKKKEEKPAAGAQGAEEEEGDEDSDFIKKKLSDLVARDLASTVNSEELNKKHKEKFGDKILTRFPPEPNGYLHIGHAKAMRFSFRVAEEYGGHTYLRFDDTNPEKETKEFIINIEKNVRWLGYTPWKITHASDCFEDLYKFACQLIKKDKAYIDHQQPEDMHKCREEGIDSPWRNRPIEESLRIFDEMRRGLWEEGSACLRLKIDMKHPNTTMRDPVAYRIRFTAHPHAGDKWCIYPLYDFTHCISDSLEGITHSLCTLEFEIRRDLYYWTLEQLNLFRPFVWEFSRLNVSNTVISKRKLHKLVFEGKVKGWDDPRILTLNGLRRRGYTPEAINNFCDMVSVTRRGNENMISFHVLEHCIRKDLDVRAKRTMAILEPVKIVFNNVPDNFEEKLEAPDFPKDKTKGSHFIHLTKEIYVEKSDVRTKDSEGFYGIAPGKLVGLKYAIPFKVIEVQVDGKGEPNLVIAELQKTKDDKAPKPQGFLHWLSAKEAVQCEVRLYDVLFLSENPNKLDDWESDMNPNSLIVKHGSLMNKNLIGTEIEAQVQFERVGFFTVDKDSNVAGGKYVWNRTVGLVDKDKQKVLASKDEKPEKGAKAEKPKGKH